MTSMPKSPADLFRAGVGELEADRAETAVALFSQAEEGFVASQDLHSAAVSALNLASALEDLGRFSDALNVMLTSGRRDSAQIDAELRAERDLLFGLLHERLGNLSEAIDHSQSAMSAFLELGDEEHSVLASINLAGAYESAAQHEKALRVYQNASMRAAALGMNEARDEILARIASLHESS